MNATDPICLAAESGLKQIILLLHIQLIPQIITFLSIFILLLIYWRNRIAIHGNLLVSPIPHFAHFSKDTLLKFDCCYIHRQFRESAYWPQTIRKYPSFSSIQIPQKCLQFNYFTYKYPCDLLTPLPTVAIFTAPIYLYTVAYPAFHFCVMAERVRATFFAEKYEREGQKLGIWMAISIVPFFQ